MRNRERTLARRDVSEDSIRRAIISLPDVQSCKVESESNGGISAIHVVSQSKRPAKQVVRDIESLLQAEFGIALDHRKISIAKVAEVLETVPRMGLRPTLVSITFSSQGGKGDCKVVLERSGSRVCGAASGVALGGGGLRLVANATFRAVEQLVGKDVQFELLDVVRLRVANKETVIVLADYVSDGEVTSLAGCVQFEDNEHRAVVHAALDGCNRIIEKLPAAERIEYEINPFTED
jgi:hypothetical protein